MNSFFSKGDQIFLQFGYVSFYLHFLGFLVLFLLFAEKEDL